MMFIKELEDLYECTYPQKTVILNKGGPESGDDVK